MYGCIVDVCFFFFNVLYDEFKLDFVNYVVVMVNLYLIENL